MDTLETPAILGEGLRKVERRARRIPGSLPIGHEPGFTERRNPIAHWDASLTERNGEAVANGESMGLVKTETVLAERNCRLDPTNERAWMMPRKIREMIGSGGARMGRDENGSYMIGADGSCMRKGPKGSVMVSADGATLRKAPPGDKS